MTRSADGLAAISGLVIALSSLSFPAFAGEDEAELDAKVEAILTIDGDPAYGEYLSGECVTCHRRSTPAGGIPPISGIDEEHFVRAIVEYREGVRANEVMRTTAARLSEEEIAALAAHFTERRPR